MRRLVSREVLEPTLYSTKDEFSSFSLAWPCILQNIYWTASIPGHSFPQEFTSLLLHRRLRIVMSLGNVEGIEVHLNLIIGAALGSWPSTFMFLASFNALWDKCRQMVVSPSWRRWSYLLFKVTLCRWQSKVEIFETPGSSPLSAWK